MWLWHLPFCRHSSNPRFSMSCASSAMFGLLHATPGVKKHVQGIEDCFQIMWCLNHWRRYIFYSWNMFEFIELILTGNMADMASNTKGYQMQHAFQPSGWVQGISKLQCWLSSGGVSVATISKTFDFSWLPRLDTVALRSLRRPWFGCPEAPWGQGCRGCEGRRRPWPRIWGCGVETSVRHRMVVGKWMQCCWFKFSVFVGS